MEKRKANDKAELRKVITPEFRVSYPHVFKPQQVKPTDKPKFSVTMLFPKDEELMCNYIGGAPISLKKVMRLAKIAAFGADKSEWPDNLASPVRDGDDPEFKGKEGYKGHWAIKATTGEDQRPGVVDADGLPITEPGLFYPGCYARAYVYCYVWEYMKKQGVGFILEHVQKTREGKSFGGKKPVDQVFAPIKAAQDDDDDADDMTF